MKLRRPRSAPSGTRAARRSASLPPVRRASCEPGLPGPRPAPPEGNGASETSEEPQPPAQAAARPAVPRRIQELHSLHGERQLRKQQLRERAEEAEAQRIAAEVEALRGDRPPPSPLTQVDLKDAVNRLHAQHRTTQLRIWLQRCRQERAEQQELEESRARSRPRLRSQPAVRRPAQDHGEPPV